MKSEYQGELFKEFANKESSLKTFSKNILPNRKPRILHVSVQHVISVVILVILALIVSFALGVENGKRQRAPQETKPPLEAVEIVEKVESRKQDVALEPKIDEAVKPVVAKPVVKEIEPYTIQLASYGNKKDADKKIKKLKTEGIDAFLVRSDKWFQICSGSYANKKDAEKDLNNLSKKYKGCFLRKKE